MNCSLMIAAFFHAIFSEGGEAYGKKTSAAGQAGYGILVRDRDVLRRRMHCPSGHAVVSGGTRMGAGGSVGFVGRAFGGIAARNGASLSGESIASVASRPAAVSGSIGGDIADRSLQNYMPQFAGRQLKNTQISGGRISTQSVGADGKQTSVEMFSTSQFDRPAGPHALVTASDGSQWYQVARGSDAGSFYDAPYFSGSADEAAQVASFFPDAPEGTMLRSVGQGEIEAISPDGTSSMWYNSAMFEEPDAPHSIMESANGVDWYAMQPHAEAPGFESESSPASSQPGMVNDFSAVEPASSVSSDGYSQPNVAGESVPAPENADYTYTPAPFMDAQGTDSSGYSDSIGIPPDAPLDSPITDISLSDTGAPSHHTPGADVPDIGVEPQFGNTDVSLDIPQTGSGMPGSHDIGIIEPVSDGAPQYDTADTGASVY